jgi:hypothetical protein
LLKVGNEENESYSISKYQGQLTPNVLATQIKKLQAAFPKQSLDFFNILVERVKANGFSDERLTDAVNNVIDNFQYKELNISDIIRWDKRVKLISYQQLVSLVTSGKEKMTDWEMTEINGHKLWRKK